MDVEFEIQQVDGKWQAVCKEYLVILESRDFHDLIDEIRIWVKKRFPDKNVKIILKTSAGDSRSEIYVPGPARPLGIDPSMFRK